MVKQIAKVRSKIKNISQKSLEVRVKVPEDHLFVTLTAILEWEQLIEIARVRRSAVLKIPQVGRRPLSVNAALGNANEFDCSVKAVQEHIALFGKPPKEFGYDRGGWSKIHMEKIKKLGVKQVAVAPKGKAKWNVSNRCKERMSRERAQVEGSIGCLKRVGFNRPYSKNTQSALRAGHRAALRLNMTKLVRDVNLAMAT